MKKEQETVRKTIRRPAVCLLAVLLGVMTVFTACQTINDPDPVESSLPVSGAESEDPGEVRDLAEGCPYFFEYGAEVKGDDHLNVLTGKGGNVQLKPLNGETELLMNTVDWSSKAREIMVKNDAVALSVDLGFVSEVTGFKLDGIETVCDVYYSTDGYNFSFYLGAFDASSDIPATKVKALQFVIPYPESGELTLKRIRVFGRSAYRRELVSLGATYTSSAKAIRGYADEAGTRLTDGKSVEEAGEETVAGFQGGEKDPVTGKSGVVLTLDLGGSKNVSDVLFGYFAAPDRKSTPPDRITVRVSEDGENWTDFGQSYLRTFSGGIGTASRLYFVTHPETVNARYVRLFTYENTFLTDEIRVYGCDRPVQANDTFLNRSAQPSDTNIAAYAKCTFNGTDAELLTDRTYTEYMTSEADNEVVITFGGKVDDLCAVSATYTGSPTGWTFKDGDGNALEPIQEYAVKAGSKTDHNWYFAASKADRIVIGFSGKGTRLFECAAYASAAQLPLVRGGFFQVPTAGASTDNASNNSPYSWYLELKGMKDLGMDYVVLQYGASYKAKTVIFDGKRLKNAGYTYTPTYGSEDLPGAMLDAADKLGMKVWLGTIEGADFSTPSMAETQKTYAAVAADGVLAIEDIQERYGSHPSFAGFYFADEQCDYWLNMRGGPEAARMVYKPQSDRIRELNPKATIMISPAIWRSGNATTGADNLYRAIRGENGGRPLVDIVSAQDCLGRTDTLTVSASVYDEYERYCAEWAKAVRRAGAEFWHDAEVFEQVYTAKRAEETVHSLGIQSKLSGSVIVFDIPHYMTLFPSASYGNLRSLYLMRQTRAYAKYYASFALLDWMGEHARKVETSSEDGHEVSVDDTSEPGAGAAGEPGIQQPEPRNPGIITEGSEPDNWQDFVAKNGSATPKFAYSFDEEAFYVAVETGDQTANYQKGVWWSGEDDLLQIWMMPNGQDSTTVLNTEYGIRFYLHRTPSGWVKGGEAGSNKTDLTKFTFTEDNGSFLIKMPWTALGIRPPQHEDGTAIGIVLQYIDGQDLTWAASEGTKGPSVPARALYSF
ncbi:MAG: DUF4434 domain-containing protein [Clostridia bacterium]|nr:DUF4434 domain-containing protein [Clostridia bacterium]